MAYEPTNTDIYNLIHSLCGRIENLERYIAKMTENRELNIDKYRSKLGLDPPELFEDWIKTYKISHDHYELIFVSKGGDLQAFKHMLSYNINENTPLFKYKRAIYVYMSINNEPEWCLFNDENLRIIIQEMWFKTLKFHLAHINDDDCNDETRDVKYSMVSKMRQNLFEVKKTKQNIRKWLGNIL